MNNEDINLEILKLQKDANELIRNKSGATKIERKELSESIAIIQKQIETLKSQMQDNYND